VPRIFRCARARDSRPGAASSNAAVAWESSCHPGISAGRNPGCCGSDQIHFLGRTIGGEHRVARGSSANVPCLAIRRMGCVTGPGAGHGHASNACRRRGGGRSAGRQLPQWDQNYLEESSRELRIPIAGIQASAETPLRTNPSRPTRKEPIQQDPRQGHRVAAARRSARHGATSLASSRSRSPCRRLGVRSPRAPPSLSVMQLADSDQQTQYGRDGSRECPASGFSRATEGKRRASMARSHPA
jgi:hypothetical protein